MPGDKEINMPQINRIGALRAFFDKPPLTMEELKALNVDERKYLGDAARDALIRQGTHKAEDFDPEAFK